LGIAQEEGEGAEGTLLFFLSPMDRYRIGRRETKKNPLMIKGGKM